MSTPRSRVLSAALITYVLFLGNQARASVTFLEPAIYAVGINPTDVVVTDFDADGNLDLVVANSGLGSNGSISILPGLGGGSFGPRVDYGGFGGVGAVASGDLLAGQSLDLVASDHQANSIVIFRGIRAGRLANRMILDTGREPLGLAVEDLNTDGAPDILVANFQSGTLSVFLRKNPSSFQARLDFPTGQGPDRLLTGDFNGDGRIDVVVTNLYDGTISMLLGRGDGTFEPKTDTLVSDDLFQSTPLGVAAGDLDGDGVTDVAVARFGRNRVAVLLGDGTGGFLKKTDYLVGPTPARCAIADLDADGKAELVVTNLQGNSVTILSRNPDGTLGSRQDISSGGGGAVGLAIADLNRDGRPDMVVTNSYGGTAAVFLASGSGSIALEGQKSGASTRNAASSRVAVSLSPPQDLLGRIVSINPTPSMGQASVRIASQTSRSLIVRVVNASGKVVQEARVDSPSGEVALPLDTRELTAGIYFVECKTVEGLPLGTAKKLVVIH